jgi:hypothetical protein
MQKNAIKLEEVANQFQLWRAKQNSKFSPIPTHLRVHIGQLIGFYPVPQIAAALNISKATIYSIKKEQDQDQNSYTLEESADDAEQNLNFIPFTLVDTTELAPVICCTCQIIKPDGAKLIINIPDPTNVIRAFLCCN